MTMFDIDFYVEYWTSIKLHILLNFVFIIII